MIRADNIWFSFNSRPVIKGLSCHFAPGRFYSVLGPNGSGKTTFLDLLSGFLNADKGQIRINGTKNTEMAKNELAQNIALVSQNYDIRFPFTVEQVVLMGRHPYVNRFSRPDTRDIEKARQAMEDTDILHLKDRRINRLSGGEKQRCIFARALAQDTPALLLDEAFSSMDIAHSLHLLKLVKELVLEQNRMVIAVFHDLNLAGAFSDALLFIKQGKMVAFGETEQVMTRENIQHVFQVDSRIVFSRYTNALQAHFKVN